MQLTFRTILRGFLIVAGAYFLVTGVLGGTILELLLGAAGVILGGGGLYFEWRSTAADGDDVATEATADDPMVSNTDDDGSVSLTSADDDSVPLNTVDVGSADDSSSVDTAGTDDPQRDSP